MESVCILYPCYFSAGLKRSEGRRVPVGRAVKNPTVDDIGAALKRCGYTYRAEEKHHPAHWFKREGRVVVECTESKGTLIKKVAGTIEVRQ
ncbi:MAG: signal recognition particle subunit SRP19/SEC65 family protein [Methanofollis sp.]|uniref:signal recognition particle subunit SRP19/SEC65 family protein n=1 Tax=Methanofollis sp. TaxID=2052835 RepID=UPI0026348C80|nr:signal recognition particle subunit SRP19/SEC65 family protein [Methanofollis sp.]MDD4253922.1 signal recognition particle subunit SRP19/SEC65 family protein [Methanofollis sp.]